MKELEFLLKPEYIENYINQKPFKFDEKIPRNITWDEVFTLVDEDFNYAIENNLEYNEGWKTADNPFHKYGKAGYGFKVPKMEKIKAVQEIRDVLLTIFDPCIFENYTRYAAYVTLTTNKLLRIVPHTDGANVFFWQILGKAEWNIYSIDGESIDHTFLLEEGDMIFCPFERKHHVNALTPRAGVSFGFGPLKSDIINTL